ncbi:hypothetical protein CLV98_104169 [Dyadobacter jejuensis]|uniref:Uncharacterized protein n=1 Tax=Dyadobacter jejuensis TaxID=1082580 RepID=A0A316ANE8_9BACT|nr:hypothetical protein [Dyadobacter jejuensis]PWJ58310.1 hypothetical protein CLV98_104169 [Dyadobacter jejuensis]
MKIRIFDNSVRIRLSKKEVAQLSETGYLESRTLFGTGELIYAIAQHPSQDTLSARFVDQKITIEVPVDFLNTWPTNDVVGMNANQPLPDGQNLYILIEKDFKCLDNTSEDQSDNYENPNSTC